MWPFPFLTMCYCWGSGLLPIAPCVTLRRLLAQNGNSYDWLWPYVALVIRLLHHTECCNTLITEDTFVRAGHKTNAFWMWYQYTTLTTVGFWWLQAWLCSALILFGEGQSRVCTRVFRWWFTYILSSWVIEWLSHFSFIKVGIYCRRILNHVL